MPKYEADTLPGDADLVVTGKYVTAKTMTTDGWTVVGFHEGAPLPKDVPLEDKRHLYRNGLVREVGWSPDQEPDTSADEAVVYAESVLAGAEANRDRAQQLVDEAQERLSDARARKAAAAKRSRQNEQAEDPEPAKAGPGSPKAPAVPGPKAGG
jgi:hypothetical protein